MLGPSWQLEITSIPLALALRCILKSAQATNISSTRRCRQLENEILMNEAN